MTSQENHSRFFDGTFQHFFLESDDSKKKLLWGGRFPDFCDSRWLLVLRKCYTKFPCQWHCGQRSTDLKKSLSVLKVQRQEIIAKYIQQMRFDFGIKLFENHSDASARRIINHLKTGLER